ncbi:hypothetical protein JZ751_015593 [Albula glossodonta]|uniref:Uncharacterized protein n=1 Tax=Albula glossodonta TaxID=121402 RepID=A0A8T2NUE1_9TELE|nr:hypothetical protein JZ751_015593 [Albula glossodonta]
MKAPPTTPLPATTSYGHTFREGGGHLPHPLARQACPGQLSLESVIITRMRTAPFTAPVSKRLAREPQH